MTTAAGGQPETGTAPAILRYLAAWFAGALPAFLIITLLWLHPGRTTPFGYLALGAFALAFPVMVRRLGVPRRIDFVYFLLLAGIAFGILSILTGWGNGLTDEPFTTPRFAGFLLSGHDPYTTQLVFTYQQYGQTLSSRSYYVYLPLLMFLQIPGISYKWVTLGCWALMVLLARKRFDTASVLAQPYVLLIAASGYNDLPVLLLLTLGFVGLGGRRQKWAEYLSLGCKQFANAFVFVYYLVRRRWVDSLVTIGVSAAFLVPFLVWGGPAVLCPAVFANRLPSCPAGGNAALLLNYPVWAVWVVAVFYVSASRIVRDWSRRPSIESRLSRVKLARARFASLPALAIVAASAVGIGLATFVVVTIEIGLATTGVILAAALGGFAAVLWSLAWNGTRVSPATPGPALHGAALRLVVCLLLLLGLDLLTTWAWFATGRGPLTGLTLGLSIGVVVSSALGWWWDVWQPNPSGDALTPSNADAPRENPG